MEKLKPGMLLSKSLFHYKPLNASEMQASGNTSWTLTTRTTTNCFAEHLRIRGKRSR